MPSKAKIILWNKNVPFSSLEIPKEDLFCYATSYVFNTFGLHISSKDSAFGKKDRTRSYYCTCAYCKPVTPPSSRWKISFRQTTPRSKSSTGSKNLDTLFKLIGHEENSQNPHYTQVSSTHTDISWSTKKYQLLANYPPFQVLIKCHYLSDIFPSDQLLYEQFRIQNPNFHIEVTSEARKQTTNKIKKFNKAKNSVLNRLKEKTRSDEEEFYVQLPAYLLFLQQKNPNVTIAFQNDTKGCFMRCFVATPIATDQFFGKLTYPVFVSDCAHYKTKYYDGVLFNLSTKTIFGQIVILAYAVIPRESVWHLCWVIQMCWIHRIPVEKYPFFTDQGPLIDVFSAMMHTWGISFQVMLCLEHFQRNIRHNFKNVFPLQMRTKFKLQQPNSRQPPQ